jgi:hypothetical protein
VECKEPAQARGTYKSGQGIDLVGVQKVRWGKGGTSKS